MINLATSCSFHVFDLDTRRFVTIAESGSSVTLLGEVSHTHEEIGEGRIIGAGGGQTHLMLSFYYPCYKWQSMCDVIIFKIFFLKSNLTQI